jgi:peptidoglycan hydrolase-like protein with peptidoglycan-binding domain
MKRVFLAAAAMMILPALAAAQSSSKKNAGLTHDQMHELQQALKDDGCYTGRVDGQLGPKTRAAINCARRKHDIDGNNANELFRALNVNFTIDDSTGMGGIMRSGNRQPERRTPRSGDDTGSNRGRAQRDTAGAHEDHDRTARGDTASGMENKGKKSERGKKPVKP